ncbi:hypothetical protein QBC39DRAFT_302504 [Podospora conica]|nr:hypothetical protein QBC39DRAFT_302504 [Schizothecium conicum]
MEKHGRLMVEEVTLAHISKAHEEWSAARKHYDEERQGRDDQFFNSVEQYIQPISYDKRLDELRTSICEGTGDWLPKDDTFNRWLDPTDATTNVVWVQGFPGAGKTYLASRVVDHAKSKGFELFAFLRYNQEATAAIVLQSLIFQLVSFEKDLRETLCSELRSTTRDLKRDLKSNTSFAANMLLKLIKCASSPVYIIVDGLDEIDNYGRHLILEQLLGLGAKVSGEGTLKLFISSRREDNIERLLRGSKHEVIRLDQKNAGCIRKYIATESRHWLMGFDKEIRSDLESLLVFLPIDAEGMFLYARLVMSTIKILPPQIELIRQELRVPPKSLAEAYQRVLQRINDMPSSVCKISKRILAYIACSPVPIMVREMEQFILLDPGVLEEVHPVRARMNVIQYCGPLVEVVEDRLQFVHFTAKEYLCAPDVTEGFINPSDALLDLTETCLRYLSTDLFDEDANDNDLVETIVSGRFRLSHFACSEWYSLTRRYIMRLKESAVPGRLISALEDFAAARGSPFREEQPSPPFQPPGLHSVKEGFPEIHAFLCRMADFVKKKEDTGDWCLGEAETWVNLDPTTLSTTSSRIHHLLDQTIATTHKAALQPHYGSGLYKCDYILCPSNRLGFETKSTRDAHVVRHKRPFKCSKPDCEFAIIGFTSEKIRDEHCSQHPELLPQQTTPLGITIPSDVMEAKALLAQLVAADRVSDVKALVEERKDQFDSNFLEDLMRRVAFSGSEAMCRLIMDRDGPFKLLSQGSSVFCQELAKIAIQSENSSLLLLLLQGNHYSHGGCVRAVLASDSLWAFEICAPNWQDAWLGKLLGDVYKPLNIGAAQELRLVALLANNEYFQGLQTTELSKFLRFAVSSLSFALARFLVELGADVNVGNVYSDKRKGHRSKRSILHQALKKSSLEAAEFAKYLLLSGADPYKVYVQGKGLTARLPGMEPCARDMKKWLGKTWDELVDSTQKERARQGQSVYTPPDPSEIKGIVKMALEKRLQR